MALIITIGYQGQVDYNNISFSCYGALVFSNIVSVYASIFAIAQIVLKVANVQLPFV